MKNPQIDLIPLKSAVSSEKNTTLDVLLKIIPPEAETEKTRPPLNLSLVLDRSGSMEGHKIDYVRRASCYAVEQLLPTDRISIVIYNNEIKTLIPSCFATDKTYIIKKIQEINAYNGTCLHGGWLEGATQVEKYVNSEYLNRVILLSDGLANIGETDIDKIASHVHKYAKKTVTTSTMGVGEDYNEDLMEAMAKSGDGNYYYIENIDTIPSIFQQEMQGVLKAFGTNVKLRIEAQYDVELIDVLNDLEINFQGEYQLPNLLRGNPFIVVVRLQVDPITTAKNLCNFRLSWDDVETKERQKMQVSLELPVVSETELQATRLNEEVQEQVALMKVARAKKQAVQKLDQGDYHGAKNLLEAIRLEMLNVPSSPRLQQEITSLSDLQENLQQREYQKYRKRSLYESHSVSYSSHQSSHGSYYIERYLKILGDRVEILKGDITQMKTEAIVNASNVNLSGSVGVDAAIHRAAGVQLTEACRQLGGCAIGEVKITPGYNLAAKWVIHTVGPNWEGDHREERHSLARCYENCLQLAVNQGIKTIAFPAISTGAKGFHLEIATEIALEVVTNFLIRNTAIEKVIFVCYDIQTYNFYLSFYRS